MLTKSRITLAAALVTLALGASPALALAQTDARGEYAASLSETKPSADLRTADAREPVGGGGQTAAQPVVVEIDDGVQSGFDWTAAIIGMGAGLALAVLAVAGVAGGRRRPSAV